MNEIIQIKEVQEYELMKLQSGAFFRSGMFPDIKLHEQALVKVMVGKEMGINPFQSLTGIHMVNGKPEISARLMSSLISRHPDYFYRVIKSTEEVCEIDFYDKKNPASDKNHKIGTVSFTMAEAQKAGLAGKDNWKKYPADMLFARALSRGARRMAAAAFFGVPVYVEGELDANKVIEHESLMPIPKETRVNADENGILLARQDETLAYAMKDVEKETKSDAVSIAVIPPHEIAKNENQLMSGKMPGELINLNEEIR